ncbi:hypothetical protein Tco_1508659 [Tanacetum coccineum]
MWLTYLISHIQQKTSHEAAKYVANGGIIGVVSTATYELFVLNFGLILDLKGDPSQMIDIHRRFKDIPNIQKFPEGKGPEIFRGKADGMESEHNYLQYLTHFTTSDTLNGRFAPVVVNFAIGYFGFKLDERLKIRSNGMLLASCNFDFVESSDFSYIYSFIAMMKITSAFIGLKH